MNVIIKEGPIRVDFNHSQVLKHVARFFKFDCAVDIMARKLFPNIKEISESMGAFNAVKEHLNYDSNDESVTVVVVGDGNTPRTGSIFAFMTKWNVISVDPIMNVSDGYGENTFDIKRLLTFKSKIENMIIIEDKVIIVCVHSHAKTSNCLKHVNGRQRSLVSIPCCFKPDIDQKPDVTYIDHGILSPKNEVMIWKDV